MEAGANKGDFFRSLQPPKTEKRYLKQIRELGGVNSCYSTSILNGLIHQEILLYDHAESIQTRMLEDRDSWFGGHLDLGGGKTVRTYNRTLPKLATFIEGFIGGRVNLDYYDVSKLWSLEAHLRNMISYGYSAVAGNEVHAVLLIEYLKNIDAFRKVDPRLPDQYMTIGVKKNH